ncbi:MAG: putative glycoside hydrolase [Halanaerobiaceae bacterium]|nr:putative glycoside hydrolase [Halanaerobiaceae bacterium]
MKRKSYFFLIFFTLFLLNFQNINAGIKLTYSLDNIYPERDLSFGNTVIDSVDPDREFSLNNSDIELYIPEFYVRGVYVTGWAAGSERMNDLIELVENTILTAMVIDIKDQDGYLSYYSSVPLAQEIGANKRKISNPRALLERLHSKDIYTIARISVFKDDVLARRRRDLALRIYDSENHKIIKDPCWLDPSKKEVWEYNIMLAREAAALGFDEIQFDYVRYPALGNGPLIALAPELRPKSSYINDFVKYSIEALADLDVPVSVDVFGLTTSVRGDMGIGQNFQELCEIVDIISPMVYPSHYSEGVYGIPEPDREPYQVVYRGLLDAQKKVNNKENFIIRPWLQDFSLKSRYTKEDIQAQIKAAESLGIKEWLLWNPGSRYTEEAVKSHHFR